MVCGLVCDVCLLSSFGIFLADCAWAGIQLRPVLRVPGTPLRPLLVPVGASVLHVPLVLLLKDYRSY